MSKLRSLPGALKFMYGNILVLTITRSLGMFCRSMVFPYASLYLLALGGDPSQIGFVNSLNPLVGLIVFPIAGYLTDHAGRVKIIVIAGYVGAALILLFVFAPNWQTIALAKLLLGFTVVQFPPTSAINADSLTPEQRGTVMATKNTLSGALAIFAPYAAGAFLDAYDVKLGMRVLYALMAAANLASATLHLYFLKETSSRTPDRLRLADLPAAFKQAYGDIPAMLRQLPRSLKALAAVITLSFVANAVASAFWVVYATEHIGLSSTQWGSILLLETLLRSVMYIPAGLIVDRHGRMRCIVGALLLSLLCTPTFVLATRFLHVLLIRLATATATAFFIPACSALMADTVPRNTRGRVMAAIGRGTVMLGAAAGGTGGPGMGFMTTVPVMIGCLAGGYLYAYHPALPWGFVLVATALSILLALLLIRDPKHAET